MKRVMFFIDGSNVFYDWRNEHGTKQLDIKKYIDGIRTLYSDYECIRTYYFTSQTKDNASFLNFVKTTDYTDVICGRLQEKEIRLDGHGVSCPVCGTTQDQTIVTMVDKGTDVNIAVEMLKHAYQNSYDTAVLISRDSDFCGVVEIIKSLGKNVELVLFEGMKGYARELRLSVDKTRILSKSMSASFEKVIAES